MAIATDAATSINASLGERELFARGKEILGKSAGGLTANLLKAKGGPLDGHVAMATSDTSTQNEEAHVSAPALPALRGRVILNSVNSPGRVSTSMNPACCL